ncbi:MAG: LON peptidase substrate-binding domain-containing protein [Pseudomonadota bacterium]|nr:LON peptidase substrate-binding domain-containing protein [Pseudomonadota bacterium]
MDLPLFPLNTVLFPGSRLDLRIFEPRYLDMIRDCMRADIGFGVCMILDGRDAGQPAIPATLGTQAHIVDFSTLPDGLLGITVQGGARVRIDGTRVNGAGLTIGDVAVLAPDPQLLIPTQHALLVTILQRLADHEDTELSRASKSSFDDAAWVGFRLADRMPIALDDRQLILRMDDPLARLDQLAHWLPRFQRE